MTQLLFCFLYTGLISVGGGFATISILRQLLVERLGLLSAQTFVDLTAIAEMTPGPIAVNVATFVGMRLRGLGGAMVATAACVLPGCAIALTLGWVNRRLAASGRWAGVMRSLRACVVGMILAGSLTIFRDVLAASEGGAAIAAALGSVALGVWALHRWRIHPALWILLGGGALGMLHFGLRALMT